MGGGGNEKVFLFRIKSYHIILFYVLQWWKQQCPGTIAYRRDNLGTITINGMSDILYDMSVFSHLKANVGTNTEAIGLQKISSRS